MNTRTPKWAWSFLEFLEARISEHLYNFGIILQYVGVSNRKRKAGPESEIEDPMERQLSSMKFYRDDDVSSETQSLMIQTPKTNLGGEGEFSQGDMDLKRAGGSTSLKTISDEHVIKRTALYKKSKWTSLGKEEKRRRWRWASSSAPAKKVDLSVFIVVLVILILDSGERTDESEDDGKSRGLQSTW